MARVTGIGHQDFGGVIEDDIFYVDKTLFIKEWWENRDTVTLIARHRRFGKTLNMSIIQPAGYLRACSLEPSAGRRIPAGGKRFCG